MTLVARKLAMVRAGVQEVKKIEDRLQASGSADRSQREVRQDITDMADAAQKVKGWSDEAVGVLEGIKRNVEGYMRELRNAVD